jgi:hypothetical protein
MGEIGSARECGGPRGTKYQRHGVHNHRWQGDIRSHRQVSSIAVANSDPESYARTHPNAYPNTATYSHTLPKSDTCDCKLAVATDVGGSGGIKGDDLSKWVAPLFCARDDRFKQAYLLRVAVIVAVVVLNDF